MLTDQVRFFTIMGIFGAGGVLTRTLLIALIAPRSPNFPFGTLAVNLIGSLLIGMVYALHWERPLVSDELAKFIMIGFLGGFTTFSAVSLEGFNLIQNDRIFSALAYLIGSPLAGLLCAYFGYLMVKR